MTRVRKGSLSWSLSRPTLVRRVFLLERMLWIQGTVDSGHCQFRALWILLLTRLAHKPCLE